MKKRSLLITFLSLILTFSVSIGLTTTKAYAEETPVEYSMGDANLDGNVNTRDVVLIKQSIVGLTELTDKQKVFADVYADGQINTRDVVLIQQSIVGMDVDLGTHEHEYENGVCICGYVEPHTHNYSELKFDVDSHWYECSCGAYETKENHIPGAEATETTDQKCTECNYVITSALGHVHTLHLTKVDAKSQSCTEEGNVEYYTCSCGKWFTDNTATTEITDKSSVVIEKDAHKYETLKKTATEHWWECSCGAYETKENHKGGTATCQVKATCSVCDTVYGDFAEHEPKTAWVITDTHHYHECSYGCNEKLNYSEHSFTNYVSNKDATYESDGTKTATCDGGCGKTHTVTDVGSMLIKDEIRFTTLNVDGKNVYGTVSNSVEKFYFKDEIVTSGNANFIVSYDEDGIQSSVTKSMPLVEGNNTFYVLETINGVYNQTYIITIHRNYMFTVNFMVDDEAIKTEQIEENQQVFAPEEQKKYGYTFDGWQANSSFVSFPYTVTKNTTFTAVYTPIRYNVTYQIDTYDLDGVITSKTETLTYTIEDMVNGIYTLKNTVIDDYVFYGWTTEKQFEPENPITSVNELNDYIFYGYYEYGTKGVVYEKTGEIYAVAGYEGTDSDFIIAVLHNGLPVTTINQSALKDNLTVESITISKYVSSIGLFAFNGCKNVTQVYYAADNCQNLAEDTRAFYYLGQNKTGVTVTIADNVQRIPEHLFFAWILNTSNIYHPKLKTVQFEDNSICQEIGKRAFGWCFEIVNIEIPESIKTIGKEAFSKLYYVENIYFNAIECGDVAVTDKVFEDLSKHNNGAIITVGKNVTTIPAGMFNGTGGTTTNIKEISFATNGALTSIGSGAFAGAKKLTKVEIPETIQNVELSAFMYCSSLTEFTVPKSVKVLYLSSCTGLQEITFNSVLEELYVDSCSSLTNVTLPNTLKKVDFSYCTLIETLELPDGVTSAMFTGCSKLGTMTLPTGFTEVADNMFKDCSFLKGVEFEGEVTRIGDYAFSNCTMLGGSLPSSVKHIGAHAYEYTAKTMFSASYNLESIGEYAFRDCSKLWYVSINGDVKTIEKYAFYNCIRLEDLVIEFGVENIGEYVFANCRNLPDTIELPISIREIGHYAFYPNSLILENAIVPSGVASSASLNAPIVANNNIKSNNYSYVIYNGEAYLTKYYGSENSVTIPTEIDGYPVVALVGTFYNNSNLTEVYISESITWIDYDAFYNCDNITAFYLYADSKPDDWHDSWNHNKTTYWDYQGVKVFGDYQVVAYGNKAIINKYLGDDKEVIVPLNIGGYNIVDLKGEVFFENTEIETVIIPDGITSISERMFYGCTSLKKVVIPNSVTMIGEYAFYGCESLEVISLPFTGRSLNAGSDVIGVAYEQLFGYIFGGGTTNGYDLPPEGATVQYGARGSVNYDYYFYIPKTLKKVVVTGSFIGERAFTNCKMLQEIVIKESVIYVGDFAFSNCDSAIIYCESKCALESWDEYWDDFSGPIVFDCKNNDVSNDGYIYTYFDGLMYKIKYEEAIVATQPKTITTANIKDKISYKENSYIVISISDRAFYDCDNLTSVLIGNNVSIIGEYAFYDCDSLTSIEIPNSVTSIGDRAFYECALTNLLIGSGVTSIGEKAFFACNLVEIKYNAINCKAISTSGCVFDYAGGWDKGVKVIIGKGVKSIPANLFCPNSANSSPKITEVIFEESSICESIGSAAFENCSSLTNVTIGDSVTSIGSSAFLNCSSLTGVVIGNSVTSIGFYAFSGCSSLKTVYYVGTAEDWDNISINSSGNSLLNNVTRYYYVENESVLPADGGNYWHYVDGVPTVWTKD